MCKMHGHVVMVIILNYHHVNKCRSKLCSCKYVNAGGYLLFFSYNVKRIYKASCLNGMCSTEAGMHVIYINFVKI